ncbi:MAG: Na+/H+ antiporter NhaC family protein [Clostridiales bacterium]|nr:Na+/H+ antiporter NhaC family protein [Clostridiales bacterium]
MEGTFWAIVPTLIAVVFALITKNVFVSLFLGILTGAMLIAGGNPIVALNELFSIMANKMGADIIVSDGGTRISGLGNAGILIFILELGILVALMNKAGGTAAFGSFIMRRIKSKKSALLSTTGLGCLIFMDDYFNRLAVGTIMRPATDKFGISRIKLAYIIGSVSVSICILVPISSWASAITGNIGEGLSESANAFNLYLDTLLCNFYPILTLIFLFISPIFNIEPIGMKNIKVVSADNSTSDTTIDTKGKAYDLILPILALIVLSLVFMIFSDYTSETYLVMSGAITILFCLVLYLPRKIMSLKEFTECFSSGFKTVVDVIIILVFAWTLTGVCERLGVGMFIKNLTSSMGSAQSLLPAILFVAAMGTAFSTGTAWGTFGMLVPLTVPMFDAFSTLQILSIAAVLSGSVFGNQVSPISDSTLLASNVCECDHMQFIKAQLPSALLIATIAFCGFLVAGVTQQIWAGWIVSVVLFATLVAISAAKKRTRMPKSTIIAETIK